MKTLRGKNAVVTGASSGIGWALALELAREGMNVVLAARREPEIAKLAALIQSTGVKALVRKTDVSDKDQVKYLIDFSIRELGGIDVLVNNAGISGLGQVRDLSIEDDWERIMGINFWGPVYGCHHVVPHMLQRGSGHILNVASVAGLTPGAGTAPYSASKAAVIALSAALRYEVARFGVGVTCVCPAFVKTEVFESSQVKRVAIDMSKVNKLWGQDPDKTAKLMVRGIKKNKGLLVITPEAKALYSMKRFTPSLVDAIGFLTARRLEQMRKDAPTAG